MKQLGRGDLTDRASAEGGMGRFEQPAVLLQRRLRPLFPSLLLQKFFRDLAKTVAAGSLCDLLEPALEARVLAGGEQLAGGFAAVRRASRADIRLTVSEKYSNS